MMSHRYYVVFTTLLLREIRRFLSFWMDALLPSIISTALYFLIFGHLMGERIGMMDGFSYIEYIAPGLIMMTVVTNAYANVTFSFFTAKFFHSIDDMLSAPIPNWLLLTSYIAGGVMRGLVVALLVTATALLFTGLRMQHPLFIIGVVLLTATVCSLVGFINGVFAKQFDDIGFVPTFVLTPLTSLGGVFFPITLLPGVWKTIALFNPLLYVINLFRYSMLGISDINVVWAVTLLIVLAIVLFGICLRLLQRGVGIKS